MKRNQERIGFICEVEKGEFLRCVPTEDDVGTYWKNTEYIWEAYAYPTEEDWKSVISLEFEEGCFERGYPKYHKVKFSYEKIPKGKNRL